MKVLLAEDSPSMMAFTSAIIKNSGHDVVPARDGREGLSLYQSAKPDLVLLDIEMPHFNGFEVAENIRSMDQKVWVPIIFLTSYQDDAYLQRGIGCGGDYYLTKPVSQIVLNAKLNAMHRLSEMQQRLLNVTRELSETNSKLHYSSITDPLTGCYNRLFLEERIVEEWEFCSCKEQELSIMIVDLDNFKTINDSNGHHAGDECLVRIAEIFKSQLNTSREKICRYGGDEFVMILPGSNQEKAIATGQNIRRKVLEFRRDFKLDVPVEFSVSIGCNSTVPARDKSLPEFIKLADQSLYEAKARGRNTVVHSAETAIPLGNHLQKTSKPVTTRW